MMWLCEMQLWMVVAVFMCHDVAVAWVVPGAPTRFPLASTVALRAQMAPRTLPMPLLRASSALKRLSMVATDTPLPAASPMAVPLPLPVHDNLVQGYLENGLKYLILPNSVPGGRFEAHLEVLSGSAFELERQQGMAHLLEHVVYMGSPKRQLISGTGSRTNAYTDFHHTVFFAACPTTMPDQLWKKPMMPMAFDALLDVMTTTVDEERMEKV